MQAPTVSETAAQRVRARRKDLGWSAQQLSDATGGALTRNVISMVETGKRRIALDELPVFARALGVPPLLLLLPLGEVAEVVAVPGEPPVSTYEAYAWWVGGSRPATPGLPAELADADGDDRG